MSEITFGLVHHIRLIQDKNEGGSIPNLVIYLGKFGKCLKNFGNIMEMIKKK